MSTTKVVYYKKTCCEVIQHTSKSSSLIKIPFKLEENCSNSRGKMTTENCKMGKIFGFKKERSFFIS